VRLLEEVSDVVLLTDHTLWHWCDPDGPVNSIFWKQFTNFELVDVDLANNAC
jgi:hypothetical protein